MTLLCRIKKALSKIWTPSSCQDATENISNDIQYDTLTPKIKTDDSVNEYFKALDFAFSKKDVKNIAITGPYGAGKSTVILSYMKARHDKKHINVSLADFNISEKGSGKPSETSEIELSILQQILYKENRENLPDSRIDRIKNRNKKHVFSIFSSFLWFVTPLFILCLTVFTPKILIFFEAEKEVILYFKEHYIYRMILSIIFALIGLFFIIRGASKAGIFDKKLKLSKIAFLQGKAEMTSQESSSLLNNCLDEIVYFFSVSKYKIVVFEDLDRLGNTEIFVKLREINQIVNNNIRGNWPVIFIYAVRDDIFLGSDVRTKFFDFILPIIPVMDSRNAYTILKEKIKNFSESEHSLLKQTSLYISDMRSLQNIVNEFNIFRNIVDNNQNEAKIFSLVFYKNLYAQDYNLIDKKSGVLYSLINDYRLKKLHEEYFKSLDDKLSSLYSRLEKLKNEKAISDSDVRKELLCRFISEKLWPYVCFAHKIDSYYSHFKTYNAEEFYKNDDTFQSFFNLNITLYIGYYFNKNNQQHVEIEGNNVINEYNKRIELVSSDRDREYKKTLGEIEKTKEIIRIRNAISLENLIKLIGREKFIKLAYKYLNSIKVPDIIGKEQLGTIRSEFKHGGLDALYYLLSNGYLMQDFMMFRSIFYKGAISVNDNDYIKSVGFYVTCEDANQNFALDNEKDVIQDLISQHFIYREGAIHHQLITYMLNHENTYNTYLDEIISNLFSKSASEILTVFTILDEKFAYSDSFRKLIITALSKNHHFDKMVSILNENELGIIQTKIAVNIVAFIAPDISSHRNKYRDFVVNTGYGLVSHLDKETIDSSLNNIKVLDIMYEDITSPVSDIEYQALRFVAENHMYSLSKDSYRIVVSTLLKEKSITYEQVDRQPMSLIVENHLQAVKQYIDKNIDLFVRNIFIDSEEESATIVEMLKHSELCDELKTQIVKEMSFTVSELTMFAETIDVSS
ncbi:AAA family ATPase [Photorhabdus cinerea]|uniref:DNA-binding protein n=1 Tax=Photorhabdus cinerea TaxID=471575 RepID=A0A7X5QAK3_9GAMM|nr:AAA family ATPase [Photorhabdus cinerea]NHB90805.1 DNA-binding protein [Photorhabdus cinerea]